MARKYLAPIRKYGFGNLLIVAIQFVALVLGVIAESGVRYLVVVFILAVITLRAVAFHLLPRIDSLLKRGNGH